MQFSEHTGTTMQSMLSLCRRILRLCLTSSTHLREMSANSLNYSRSQWRRKSRNCSVKKPNKSRLNLKKKPSHSTRLKSKKRNAFVKKSRKRPAKQLRRQRLHRKRAARTRSRYSMYQSYRSLKSLFSLVKWATSTFERGRLRNFQLRWWRKFQLRERKCKELTRELRQHCQFTRVLTTLPFLPFLFRKYNPVASQNSRSWKAWSDLERLDR